MILLNAIFTAAILYTCEASIVLNKTMELHNGLLTNYAKYIRPCIGCTGPLKINLTFYLTSLNELDELQGEMNTVGFIKVVWMEDRMMWNPLNYAGITSLLIDPAKIWIPPIMVGNPSLKISDLNAELALVRILYNGMAIWSPGDVFRTKCDYDIYKYPFDKHTCYIAVLPWAYAEHEIVLQTPEKEIFKPFYTDNGEWSLINTATKAYTANSMSVVSFYLTFQRKPEFLVVNVVLPIILLGFLNCMVYIIPTESGERVSYAITVLLSFAVFMTLVNDNIPKTSSPMSILCYYLISIFSGSVLVMASTVFNMSLFYKDPSIPIPKVYKKLAWLSYPNFCLRTPNKKISPDKQADDIQVVELKDTEFNCEKVHVDNETENGMEVENETETSNLKLTWRIVSAALDKLSFIVFNIYFLAVSFGLFAVVMRS